MITKTWKDTAFSVTLRLVPSAARNQAAHHFHRRDAEDAARVPGARRERIFLNVCYGRLRCISAGPEIAKAWKNSAFSASLRLVPSAERNRMALHLTAETQRTQERIFLNL